MFGGINHRNSSEQNYSKKSVFEEKCFDKNRKTAESEK